MYTQIKPQKMEKQYVKISSLLILLIILNYLNVNAQWNTQTVTNSGNVGIKSKIDIDTDGYPHIVCTDAYGDDKLIHTYWIGNTWQTEVLATATHYDYPIIYTVDYRVTGDNTQHIIFGMNRYSVLYYMYKDPASTWSGLISLSNQSYNISFDINYDDVVQDTILHIAIFKNDHLYYLRFEKSSGTTIESVVDGNSYAGSHNDIVVDDNGHIHISYYDSQGRDLKYAHFDGSNWQSTIVDGLNGDDVGQYTSIGLDNNNKAHISYYDATNDQLKHVIINQ